MNILQNPQHKAQIGYNGFDMSKTLKFSSSCGHILPVYYDILNPGDKINGRTVLKTRTMPLDAGAYASIEENIDWFFVPLEQIYKPFNEFYYGVQDFQSSLINPSGFSAQFPYFNLVTLYNYFLGDGISVDSSQYADTMRLLDLLGFPISAIDGVNRVESISDIANYAFIPLLPCAYQKIYYDYYRLSDRERNNALAYNLDIFHVDNKISTAAQIAAMLTLHYIPWKKDFYTNNQISPIFGPSNPSSVHFYDYQAVNQWLTSTYNLDLLDSSGNAATDGMETSVGLDSSRILQEGIGLNVANIRAMFALDKLLEITRRAGKHYDMQTLAHFGVDVPKGLSGECTFIHHSESKLDIGDIISTSAGTATIDGQSSTSVLGQIGGKGYGNNEDSGFEFVAPAHGVLMAVYYCRPVADYYQQGVDKLNTLVESSDWLKPEFDNLGMQPHFKAFNDFTYLATNQQQNSNVLSWEYRYSEWKNKPNTIHGNMAYIDQYKVWTVGKNPMSNNILNSYLVPPTYLNNIMSLSYESYYDNDGLTTVFDTDPMLHQIYFDVRKASKMSTFGLPQL